MLTVDLDSVVGPGDRVLDVGCGEGRHAHAATFETNAVVGLDADDTRLQKALEGFDTIVDEGASQELTLCRGDALSLPFADDSFDVVICTEVLEHVSTVEPAIAELARVLAPGGSLAVSTPRPGPERICWALSEDYHAVEGGHVRIVDPATVIGSIESHGLEHVGREHAHAFHTPYWWLRCLWWNREPDPALLRGYERLLEWVEFSAPPGVAKVERLFDRFLGKSTVLYFEAR
ncbi:MAG: class I SAM-dependent methyltransferase [Salinirussus sp.]